MPLVVFDEISRLNKPDLTQYGFSGASSMLYQQTIWTPEEDRYQLPDEDRVRAYFRDRFGTTTDTLFLDIEHLDYRNVGSVPESQRDAYIAILSEITRWLYEECPNSTPSKYGDPPDSNPSRLQDPVTSQAFIDYASYFSDSGNFDVWMQYLQAFGPKLYVINADITGFWTNWARGELEICNHYMPNSANKPVYGFMQPRYDPAIASPSSLRGTYLSYNDFLYILRTMDALGYTGITIWDVRKDVAWNPDEPWFQATLDYIEETGGSPPPPPPPPPPPEDPPVLVAPAVAHVGNILTVQFTNAGQLGPSEYVQMEENPAGTYMDHRWTATNNKQPNPPNASPSEGSVTFTAPSGVDDVRFRLYKNPENTRQNEVDPVTVIDSTTPVVTAPANAGPSTTVTVAFNGSPGGANEYVAMRNATTHVEIARKYTANDLATPGSSARGVTVVTMNDLSDLDLATSVTANGVAVPFVPNSRAVDTSGEEADAKVWHLGSGIPAGTLTLRVNRVNNAERMMAVAFSTLAGGDTQIDPSIVRLQEDGSLAQQNVASSPGSNAIRYAVGFWGGSSLPEIGADTDMLGFVDIGPRCILAGKERVPGQGSRPVGFVDAGTQGRAFVHFAVREITPNTGVTHDAFVARFSPASVSEDFFDLTLTPTIVPRTSGAVTFTVPASGSVEFILFSNADVALSPAAVTAITTNAAPQAIDVIITPDNPPQVGVPMVGVYLYADIEGDLEGTTTFRWFADGVVIPGATTNTYTPVSGDVGKTIQFGVTPKALTGTLTGEEVLSPESELVASTPNVECADVIQERDAALSALEQALLERDAALQALANLLASGGMPV